MTPQPRVKPNTGNTLFSTENQPSSRRGGRPRTRFISEALRNMCEEGLADECAVELRKLAKKAKHPSVRLAAVTAIADRTEGKPVQAHVVAATIDDRTAGRLAELAAILLGVPQRSPELPAQVVDNNG